MESVLFYSSLFFAGLVIGDKFQPLQVLATKAKNFLANR